MLRIYKKAACKINLITILISGENFKNKQLVQVTLRETKWWHLQLKRFFRLIHENSFFKEKQIKTNPKKIIAEKQSTEK